MKDKLELYGVAIVVLLVLILLSLIPVEILIAIGGKFSGSSPWFGFQAVVVLAWLLFWFFYALEPWVRLKLMK